MHSNYFKEPPRLLENGTRVPQGKEVSLKNPTLKKSTFYYFTYNYLEGL